MKKRQFRFKTAYFLINGVYNVPGLIICSGHGYAFKTYCCKTCGEIFAVDLELLHFKKIDVQSLGSGKLCPNCNSDLKAHLVSYPAHMFFEGVISNSTLINTPNPEETELRDVYELN